ncbi:MAG: D-tyrosyl-tRNA(Tyr) deacylase [Bdellovibrionales bacterium]|nr:D-tyrosyl-tRNA(Tyr) deacylase [Bdellovibrionales bacterium]
MRALVQRVKWAKVVVEGKTVGEIGPGLLTLLGVGHGDTEAEAEKMIAKIAKLRIFEDAEGRMNRSLLDLGDGGGHLLVSQFTLYGDTTKGNRPSFAAAGKPDAAKALYERAVVISRGLGLRTETGTFQAHMEVSLLNDGPVTLWLDSRDRAIPFGPGKE